MSERAKPFVAMVDLTPNNPPVDAWHRHYRRAYLEPFIHDDSLTPCVVTPLLPDDPRPGETWVYNGKSVTILTPPYVPSGHGGPWVRVEWGKAGNVTSALVRDLRRPPVLKTFRLALADREVTGWGKAARDSYVNVTAESRDAALAKLAEALEEVK